MKLSIIKFSLAAAVLVMPGLLAAQKSQQPSTDSDRGFTEVESVQSTLNSTERLFKLDSNVGWDFNQHFGIFGGVPLYFVDVPSSTVTAGGTTTTTPSTSHNGMGNVYLGFDINQSSSVLDYAGVLTVTGPTGSQKNGLSSGRATVDFDNRFDHAFGKFTPFFDGGLGNSVPDSLLYSRPFTSLGFVAHLEEGGGYSLSKRFSLNASAFEIVPSGNQKIYSRLVAQGQTGKAGSKNSFQSSATASGSGLTRENGFNAWVQFEPAPAWDLAVGYTRSQTFQINSIAFNLRMNVGKLLRSKKIS